MLTVETVHAEGERYAASLLLVPGLWAGRAVWRAVAGLLGHRGWECHLAEVRGLPGGHAGRAAALGEYAATLPAPPVLIGHDAGALLALAAARHAAAAALVLVAPLAPGSRGARALTISLATLRALLVGGPVPPPAGWRAALVAGDLPAAARGPVLAAWGPEDAAMVRDVAWGRIALAPVPGVPALLVAGDRDPLLPSATAAALAGAVGAEHRVLEGAGHWPLAGPAWQRAVDLVHRWVVQQLGAPLLDLYAEAMAERES